jgi:hypothetical protein
MSINKLDDCQESQPPSETSQRARVCGCFGGWMYSCPQGRTMTDNGIHHVSQWHNFETSCRHMQVVGYVVWGCHPRVMRCSCNGHSRDGRSCRASRSVSRRWVKSLRNSVVALFPTFHPSTSEPGQQQYETAMQTHAMPTLCMGAPLVHGCQRLVWITSDSLGVCVRIHVRVPSGFKP